MSQKQHLFFEFARTGKRVTAAWFAVPIGLISTVAGQIVGGIGIGILVVMAMFGNGGTDDPEAAAAEVEASLDLASLSSVEQGLFLIGFFFFAAIAIFLWVGLFEKRSIASMGFHGIGSGLFKFARGGIFAFLSMAAMAFGMQAIGYAEGSPAEVPASWMLVWPLLILMLGWIVQGSTEEIVTRGLLFQSVGARHGLIVAVIISAAVFTLLHGMNDNPS
ncbi:MAG: CPBP family intramembrane metalloprotease, partial [Aquisalinus sp.]|nr:CPBP family intramembrane metalloprotease [Aquisalinus sp.]